MLHFFRNDAGSMETRFGAYNQLLSFSLNQREAVSMHNLFQKGFQRFELSRYVYRIFRLSIKKKRKEKAERPRLIVLYRRKTS